MKNRFLNAAVVAQKIYSHVRRIVIVLRIVSARSAEVTDAGAPARQAVTTLHATARVYVKMGAIPLAAARRDSIAGNGKMRTAVAEILTAGPARQAVAIQAGIVSLNVCNPLVPV